MDSVFYLIPLFFLTAALYASVGFGGGSTYLALLVLFHVPYESIPKIALICNLLVVSGGLYHYVKAQHLALYLVTPFVLMSVPMAYLGGCILISQEMFFVLLGCCLLLAGLRMLLARELVARQQCIGTARAWGVGLPIGGGLGLLSGMVGIGGGIFLAPIMYFLGWGTPRQIAASCSVFIFVNSLAGLVGQVVKAPVAVSWPWLVPLMLAVILGGQLGSRRSVKRMSVRQLQRMTAAVILLVAVRVLWGVM